MSHVTITDVPERENDSAPSIFTDYFTSVLFILSSSRDNSSFTRGMHCGCQVGSQSINLPSHQKPPHRRDTTGDRPKN